MEANFPFAVCILWEDRYSGDGCPGIMSAGFRFYRDAAEYAANKLTYYSAFATKVEITIYRGTDVIKSLTYG